MKPIRVLLVDDHELFRDGIEMLLSLKQHITLEACFPNARSLISYLKEYPLPDMFILDINLPKTSGIELAKQLVKEYGIVNVIFLTSNSAKAFMDAALKTGAKGFLTKECSKEELVAAIESVQNGQYFFGKEIEQSRGMSISFQVQPKRKSSLIGRWKY